MLRRWLLVLPIIGVVLLLDQITKQLVVDNLLLYESIPVVPPLFQITRTFNTGVAFGFLPGAGDVFLVIAIVIVVAMLIFYPRIPDEAWLTRIAIGMIIGGALGNVIDRIRYDHVVDFIHYRIPDLISNVSNLADHAIVLGVALVLFDNWRLERREKQDDQAEEIAL